MKGRIHKGLTVFAYFTAIGLLFWGYRYLEHVANRERVSPMATFIDEVMTGAWMAALLFPLVARFARRFPVNRGNWVTRLPLHTGALIVYSLVHTSLLWALRPVLYSLFGFGRYDYGMMTARYPMEFFHDVIAYAVIVSLLYLFDRHVRAAQLETRLTQARLDNLRLQLQPHFLFNALNTISSVVYEDPGKADAMIARLSDLLRTTITDSEVAGGAARSRNGDAGIVSGNHARTIRGQPDGGCADRTRGRGMRWCLTCCLQPLVENSIRHGADPRSNAMSVTVTAVREGAITRLRIRDFGRGLPEGKVRRGTGITTRRSVCASFTARHTAWNSRTAGMAVWQ